MSLDIAQNNSMLKNNVLTSQIIFYGDLYNYIHIMSIFIVCSDGEEAGIPGCSRAEAGYSYYPGTEIGLALYLAML